MSAPTLTLMSSISINEPTANESVASPFPADGTYSIDSPSGDGYVMWQVQPFGDPPSPNGWQSIDSAKGGGESDAPEWVHDGLQKPGRRWECSATSSSGSMTFYAAAFKTGTSTPVAVTSVNITVS